MWDRVSSLRIPHINKLVRNDKGYCLDASCFFKTQLVSKRFSHICLEKAHVSKSTMTLITSVILTTSPSNIPKLEILFIRLVSPEGIQTSVCMTPDANFLS